MHVAATSSATRACRHPNRRTREHPVPQEPRPADARLRCQASRAGTHAKTEHAQSPSTVYNFPRVNKVYDCWAGDFVQPLTCESGILGLCLVTVSSRMYVYTTSSCIYEQMTYWPSHKQISHINGLSQKAPARFPRREPHVGQPVGRQVR